MADAGPIHVAVGANHRSAPLALRERLLVLDEDAPAFYRGLKRDGFAEALLLSTCDRIEVHGLHPDPGRAAEAVRERFASHGAIEAEGLGDRVYRHAGRDALRQLFAIAASLDSLIVGEPQVLGQVKAAHRRALAAGMVGGGLERRLQAAYAAAKRVRNETAIGERPVSIASAAMQIARDIHGDLAATSGLVIGVGEAGELIARRLADHGLRRLAVVHRLPALARGLAGRLGANLVEPDGLSGALAAADIVILNDGGGRYALTRDAVETALRARRRKPVFIVDAAFPPDADPAIDRVDDAFLYGLDDLERLAMTGQARRADEAASAWAIIDEALAAFDADEAGRAAVPALAWMRGHFDTVRGRVLADLPAADADEATRRLVNRLLHDPSARLRDMARDDPERAAEAERLLHRLFDDEGSDR